MLAGKFNAYQCLNSVFSRFVESRAKRKNVGQVRPTRNFIGGPCPPYKTRGVLEQLESRILLSTFTVTSLADDGGTGELRWAIQQANLGGTNTINFKSGLTGTITLTKGQLELSAGNTTITGPGASSLNISGNKASRVFLVDSGVIGSFSGVTIANGLVGGTNGGGIENDGKLVLSNCTVSGNTVTYSSTKGRGGGIYNGTQANLTVSNCTISGNMATGTDSVGDLGVNFGGGIDNAGTLMVSNSTLSSDSANYGGGGIYNTGKTTATGCIFASLSVATRATATEKYGGGGIDNLGSLTVTNCSFTGDSTGRSGGGGISNFYGSITVSNCTFTEDTASVDGGGGIANRVGAIIVTNSTFTGDSASSGGGIYCGLLYSHFASTTLTNCTFSGDSAAVKGGGIFCAGYSTINSSTFSGDSAVDGGGIFIGGIVSIANCSFATDKASYIGGGIQNGGQLTITDSTLSNNSAENGAGIADTSPSTAVNCTFCDNKAENVGGGIFFQGYSRESYNYFLLINCTISGNSAGNGGGIYTLNSPSYLANATLHNTIVVGNTLGDGVTPSDIAGAALDEGLLSGETPSSNNLVGTGGSGGLVGGANGNIIGVTLAKALLGPVQNNGGPTETIALLLGSPAIDKGDNALAVDANGNPLTTDQRGSPFVRIYNNIVDIGAFEYQPGPPQLAFHAEPGTTTAGSAINPSVAVYIEDSNGNLLTTNDSAVTLSLLTGSLSGTATVNAVNGVATFSNLVIYGAGTYELKAVDGTIPAVDSTSFIVNPAASAQLVFAAEPTNANAGAKLNPSVVVYDMDQYGNIVRTDTSMVNLSVDSGPGGISGTASVALNNGAAVFNNVWFDVPGTYTLIAQDGSRTAAVSSSFAIAQQYQLVFAAGPTNTPAGMTLGSPVVVYLMNYQGNIIRNNNSMVTLSVASGPGAIAGTFSVALSNGAAVFSNISFPTAGTYTITAKDGTFASITSSSFIVTKATQLIFAAPPTSTTAGKVYNPPVVVYVEDQFGNIVRNVNTAVTLAIHSGPAGSKVYGTVTINLNNGAAVFSNVWLQTAGSYTLTATGGSLTAPISGAFTVSPATANKLAFTTLPTSPKHAVAFTVKVSVEDIYGNVLTSQNTGTVTLALATHPTGSTLGGTLTANVVNGVATFSNLTVSLAGTYTLKASDSFSIAVATSAGIVVS